MLPGAVDRNKKRKSSAVDAGIWATSGDRWEMLKNSAFFAAVKRHRGLISLAVLACFVIYTLNSSSFRAAASSAAHGNFRANEQPPPPQTSLIVPSNNNAVAPARNDGWAAAPPSKKHLRGDAQGETKALPRPDSFGIVVVADLDKKSKDEESKKPRFVSYLQHGTLKIVSNKETRTESYSVSWGDAQKFATPMNEAGRGFELSELAWFNGKLLTFDDRTGIVFRLKDFEGAKDIRAIPEHIVMEGDGLAGKGQKHEWATVKDGELYMGSVGKEFTDNNGNVLGDSNLWVAVLDESGNIRHEDWTARFAGVRKALGCDYPGYVIHEAIEWSSVHRKWFILPRRVSTEAYDDMADEKRGSNKLVIASEDFSSFQVIQVGKVTPLRGFSSFKFLPRSDDRTIVAIKSVEIEADQFQTSFITVFDIEGHVLLEETELPGNHKFEGIAFSRDWSQDHS